MRSLNRSILCFAIILLVGCASQMEEFSVTAPVDSEIIVIQDLDITTGQTIYVPAYSEIYYADKERTINLSITLSVRNTDLTHPIFLTSVRYYDNDGHLVNEYLPQPRRLGVLASTDFFVDTGDQTGGIGANFIVEWVAEQPVYEPVVEAVMLSTTGTQGISFTSLGRVVTQIKVAD